MAIFGKKKEKQAADGSPVQEGAQGQASPPTQASMRGPPPGPGSTHIPHSSLSGPPQGILNVNGSQGPSNLSGGQGAPLGGPSGLGNSGFKFGNAGGVGVGGPASRSDLGPTGILNASGPSIIPTMGGQSSMEPPRSRKISDDTGGGQMYGGQGQGGAPLSGLPPSSGYGAGPAIQGGPGNYNSSSSTTTSPVDSSSSIPQGGSKRSQPVVFPWSQRALVMNPPRFLDETRQAPPGALSPSPFPRYGHAANTFASASGEVYLFGGLVRESVKNDLYIVHTDRISQPAPPPPQPGVQPAGPAALSGSISATLVQTTGEIPPPRVGHATVLVSNVLILWGGDTKVRADDKQDESLYLLNLSSREWTRVRSAPSDSSPDAGPVGRYGHTVSIVGSRFYIFGGQVDGNFMNDLWYFDLNSLKATPKWERVQPVSADSPPRRTGHASVTYRDKILIFGGTDGQYHYNDTWCYDVPSNSWKELSCIGYIPVPREGHATCLVDDIMYIFGGRGVDGKDLGDLASFKITNQRWYMFANMGPSPTGRSGHALTTYQNKVLVLGGESFAGGKADDPAVVHVLDTAKIKYPPDTASQNKGPASALNGARKTHVPGTQGQAGGSQSGSVSRSMSPVTEESARRAASPTTRGPGQAQPNGLVGLMQDASASGPASGIALPQQQPSQMQLQQQPERAISPTQSTVQQQRTTALRGAGGPSSNTQPTSFSAILPSSQRSASPPRIGGQGAGTTYTGPRSQRSIDNMRSQAVSPPNIAQTNPFRGVNGTLDRAMSPSAGAGAHTLPQDGFHYGGAPQQAPNGFPLQSSPNPASANAELEVLRKRELWMKSALTLAAKNGFVTPEQVQMPDGSSMIGADVPDLNIDDIDTGVAGGDKERVIRALVTLKTQLANAKSALAQQTRSESDRLAESEKARQAALQETTFYRAKLHAFEGNNPSEASRLERERTIFVERQVSDALRENAELERQLSIMREQTKLEQELRNSAEERLSDTAKRAMAAEAAQMKAYSELSALQKKSYTHESTLRDNAEKVASLNSLVARHKADAESARSTLQGANSSVDGHVSALSQLQTALAAAIARADDHERLHNVSRDLAAQHQETILRLRSDLEAKTHDASVHASRVSELEAMVGHHRAEAEAHRSAATDSLNQLLQFHQQSIATRESGAVPSHVSARISALETETDQYRQLHSEVRGLADSSAQQLQDMRDKNNNLEKQHSGLRSELAAMRSQLAIALQEVSRLKDLASAKDLEVRDRSRAVEAAQVKASLLRQFMSDRGLSIPGDEELGAKGGYAEAHVRQLEDEIDSRTKEVKDLEHRLQDSQTRIEELSRELDHVQSQNGLGAGSIENVEAKRKVERLERELQEANASYKERMSQLENDYQTAVQFVKGTEKMLRRMKDELTKYKTDNATLQSEIASLRSGSADGPNATEAARDIEALRNRLIDITQQNEESAAENRDLERRLATLLAEQKDARDKKRGLEDDHYDSRKRVEELEDQSSRLEDSLTNVRRELQETLALNQHLSSELSAAARSGGGSVNHLGVTRELVTAKSNNSQLKAENEDLSRRLGEVEDKFQLLLAASTHTPDENGRDSIAFGGSITSELDKWERDGVLNDQQEYHSSILSGASGRQ